jgi:hypothetical protein
VLKYKLTSTVGASAYSPHYFGWKKREVDESTVSLMNRFVKNINEDSLPSVP